MPNATQRKAAEFVRGLPKDVLLVCLTEYPAGKAMLQELGAELLHQEARKRFSDDQARFEGPSPLD